MLILSIVLVCLAAYAAMFLWLAWENKHAPFGYEDEGGWHPEEPDRVCKACGESYINAGAHHERCYGRVVREDLL